MSGALLQSLRSRKEPDSSDGATAGGIIGLLRASQAEPQRDALDRMLVLGTLLEGHADHVMDAVGPAVVPSVATIRAAFDKRRQRKSNPVQRIIKMLLGMDAKMAQYVRGKAFVDAVVLKVGMEQFQHHLDRARDLAVARRDRQSRRVGKARSRLDAAA